MEKAEADVKVKCRTGSCLLNLSLNRNLPIRLAYFVNGLLADVTYDKRIGETTYSVGKVSIRGGRLRCVRRRNQSGRRQEDGGAGIISDMTGIR